MRHFDARVLLLLLPAALGFGLSAVRPLHPTAARPVAMQAAAEAAGAAAWIEFIVGVAEPVVPDVSTRRAHVRYLS
jgi:hypothetical protein